MRLIIKPLQEDFTIINLGVTEIESTIHPSSVTQDDELKLGLYGDMGHTVGQIIQTTATGGKWKGDILNLMYKEKFKWIDEGKMLDLGNTMCESNEKKLKAFYANIKEGSFVKYGLRYEGIIAHETPLIMYVECGKYLIVVKSGGYDMMGYIEDLFALYDNKYYSKYYKDANNENLGVIYKNSDKDCQIEHRKYDGKVYSIDEAMRSELGDKIQWVRYPVMSNYANNEQMYFQYNIIVKNESFTKNIMPNCQEIRVLLDMKQAEDMCKKTIVDWFKIMTEAGKCIKNYYSQSDTMIKLMIKDIKKDRGEISPVNNIVFKIVIKSNIMGKIVLENRDYSFDEVIYLLKN